MYLQINPDEEVIHESYFKNSYGSKLVVVSY